MRKIIVHTAAIGVGFIGALLVFTQSDLGLGFIPQLLHNKLTFADGSNYVGEVDGEGLLSGQGRLRWRNGVQYEGEFERGLFNGHGKFSVPDSHTYEGAYVDGLEHGIGEIIYRNGDSYRGAFVMGQMEGQGQWTMQDGSMYVGQVARGGRHHGSGQLTHANGDNYTGEFKDGQMHWQGVYETSRSEVYAGNFVAGQFTGTGSYTSKNKGTVVGEFVNWMASGEGIKTDEDGNQWQGIFEDGDLNGAGEFIGVDGTHYKGSFRYGQFDGHGTLIEKNGNKYVGEFSYGQKHGKGQVEYQHPVDGVKAFSGKWEWNNLVAGDGIVTVYGSEHITEWALYNQQRLLEEALDRIRPGAADRPDLYVLGIAGWGRQEVFRREINFVEAQFARLFDTGEKAVYLVNSQRDIEHRPLATVTSINKALMRLSLVMDKDEDILFIYATSHGSEEDGLALGHSGLTLEALSPDKLSKMLASTGIKHKVVVISACHSGVFINPLKNDSTAVLTAAAADKTSFGCGDDQTFTYFGRAYFEQSLEISADFIEAFHRARSLIARWEKEQEIKASNPSMYTTETIENKLQQWQMSLNSGAASVPKSTDPVAAH